MRTTRESQEDRGAEGAALEATTPATRRDLLKASGAAAGALLLDGCARRDRVFIEQQLERSSTPPGAARWRLGVCGQCGAACGLQVRLIDGEAKKIEGSAEHPTNRGGVCALGHSALQELYHPDRITTPMRRRPGAGVELGAAAFEAASWEEALAEIGAALAAARSRSPASIAVVRRDSGSVEDGIWDRVAVALGASPSIVDEPFDRAVERVAAELVFGRAVVPAYRLSSADVVLSIGAAPLDRWRSPVAYARSLADLRARGGFYVQAEARCSASAAIADLWLPVRPGTEGILARSLGGALLEAAAGGEEDPLVQRARRILGESPPGLDQAAATCDVPERGLRYVVELLRAAERPVVMAGGAAATGRDGLAAVSSGLALDLLLGKLGERAAGVALEASPWELEGSPSPAPLRRLVERLEQGSIDVVVAVDCDPVHRAPAGWGLGERLAGAGTVVALSTLFDDTALVADWILPLQTDLERYRASLTHGASGPVVSLARPVRAARGEARHPGDVALALAATQDGLPEDRSGVLPFSDVEAAVSKLLAADQRFVPAGSSARRVLRSAMRAGFVRGAPSPAVTGAGEETELVRQPEASVGLPQADLPQADDRLQLVPFESIKSGDGRGQSRPWLQELPDPLSQVMWETWVEVAPTDAVRLGLTTGCRARLGSDTGSIEVAVFVSPATRPGTLGAVVGHGHHDLGRWARRGANLTTLLDGSLVAGTSAPVQHGVAVSLERLEDDRPAAVLARGLRGEETLPRGWGAQGIGGRGVRGHGKRPEPGEPPAEDADDLRAGSDPGGAR